EIAEQFSQMGGELIAFDEIHKYENWSNELKSIYDTFPKLTILASGSSALELHKGTHDLSRRALIYRLYGLSFREFLEIQNQINFPEYTLHQILNDHESLAKAIVMQLDEHKIKVLVK